MSFYLDDDDQFYSSSNNNIFSTQDDDYFICENCGGTDSYIDGSTGAHCCASCFTQSQTVVAASQDVGAAGESALEFEDVMGLAARTRGGRLVQQRNPSASRKSAAGDGAAVRNKGWWTKKPMEDLDRTVPLPDLLTCLWAMQRVLRQSALCTVDLILAGQPLHPSLPSPEEIRQEVLTTVKSLWTNYLAMWREGAECYGRRHPEIRFAFRDGFLLAPQKCMVIDHLSYQATLRAKKEMDNDDHDDEEGEDESDEDDEEDNDDVHSVSSSASSVGSSSSAEQKRKVSAGAKRKSSADENKPSLSADDKPTTPTTDEQPNTPIEQKKERKIRKSHNHAGAIRRLLLKYYPNTRGRKEAALFIRPSMTLCAAIVWLAVRHMGITPSHIQTWIANGSLPLLNAFDTLLYPSRRRDKKRRRVALSSDVKQESPYDSDDSADDDDDGDNEEDSKGAAQRKASLQLIATFFRMFGPPQLIYLQHLAKLVAFCAGVVSTKDFSIPPKLELGRRRAHIQKYTTSWDMDLISTQTLPLVTARMVADLGFSQEVLNKALAIMGRFPTESSTQVSTKSDPEGRPTDSTEELQQIPTCKPPTRPLARAKYISNPTQVAAVIVVACKLCPGWETWVYRLGGKQERQQQHADGQQDDSVQTTRFVPWNDQELRLINNHSSMESYLDFVENSVNKKDDDDVFPEFFDSFPGSNSTPEMGAATDWRSLDQTTAAPSLPIKTQDPSVREEESIAIAGNRNPNQPAICKRQKHHDWFLTVKKPEAVWADVNGLGNYVVYRSLAKERYLAHHGGSKPTMPKFPLESLHPHYVLLLEYVAYITRLPIRRIHVFITELDNEIHRNSLRRRKGLNNKSQ